MNDICKNSTWIRGVDDGWVPYSAKENLISTVLLAVSFPFYVMCFALFVYYKNRYERLRIRSTSLVLLATLGCICQLITGGFEFNETHLPCWFDVIISALITPLIASSLIIRTFRFYFYSRFSEVALKARANQTLDDSDTSGSSRDIQISVLKRVKIMFEPIFGLEPVKDEEEERHRREAYLLIFKFVLSKKGTAFLSFLATLPFLILAFVFIGTNPVHTAGCVNCRFPFSFFVFIIVFAIVLCFSGTLIVYRSRNFKDNWGFNRENSLSLLGAMVTVLGFILFYLLPKESTGDFHFQILEIIGFMALLVAQTLMQIVIAMRTEKNLSGGNATTSATSPEVEVQPAVLHDGKQLLSLNQIMKDASLLKLFETHLTREFGIESLLFIVDAEAWTKAFFDTAENLRAIRAKKLYNLYAAPNAVYSINIPYEMTEDLTRKIQANAINADLFGDAVVELRKLLNVGAVQRFQRTKEFAQWVSVNTISDPESAAKLVGYVST